MPIGPTKLSSAAPPVKTVRRASTVPVIRNVNWFQPRGMISLAGTGS